jgi:hypothetical protein
MRSSAAAAGLQVGRRSGQPVAPGNCLSRGPRQTTNIVCLMKWGRRLPLPDGFRAAIGSLSGPTTATAIPARTVWLRSGVKLNRSRNRLGAGHPLSGRETICVASSNTSLRTETFSTELPMILLGRTRQANYRGRRCLMSVSSGAGVLSRLGFAHPWLATPIAPFGVWLRNWVAVVRCGPRCWPPVKF